jgi:ribosome silencing factor RsfS/YbeB/iojap
MDDRSHGPIQVSKDLSLVLLRSALAKKAHDPVLIRLAGLTAIADYFLIVTGASGKQVQAIADAVLEEGRRNNLARLSVEGVQQGNWALIDFGDVIVHVFQPAVREFYDLEGLWSEAPRERFPDDILEDIRIMQETSTDEFDEFDEF